MTPETSAAQKVRIKTDRLELREFRPEDVTQPYLDWLNDPEVNRFLECRNRVQTRESSTAWIEATHADPSRDLFGIYLDGVHIGNATLYLIEPAHKVCRIGIVLGRKDLQGKGFAKETLSAVVRFVFEELGFHRIEAGFYDGNDASMRLFRSVGFRDEAVFKERLQFEGGAIDMVLMALLRKDWEKNG